MRKVPRSQSQNTCGLYSVCVGDEATFLDCLQEISSSALSSLPLALSRYMAVQYTQLPTASSPFRLGVEILPAGRGVTEVSCELQSRSGRTEVEELRLRVPSPPSRQLLDFRFPRLERQSHATSQWPLHFVLTARHNGEEIGRLHQFVASKEWEDSHKA